MTKVTKRPEIAKGDHMALLFHDEQEHKHCILIGKKMAYCMDCGKILLEYKNKDEFYKWLHAFETLGNDGK